MPGGLSIFRAFRSGSNPFLFPIFTLIFFLILFLGGDAVRA
ncbi:hypothetical protein HMPREF1044_0408 [Streptococcus constellatus subsp. constellatus SK53]|uniref:Uncharacterized protein n=1 Tax=Streptococcus constellatus subsp. constellatus SK53 TaxID=1095730 RepID=A0AAD2SUX7_STRCV|nr:hypothetical protein HMPREF1044_0408 [Streptococcus constellatus subsp. constellatus SK53]BBD23208.1 hypothetical protein SCSC_1549 [Streptococcus constellatus subsp. constellatus]